MATVILEKSDHEKVGEAFTPERMFAVRDVTRAAIHEIAARVKPGMVEEDAVEMAQDILADKGMIQGWHDVYVRFGTNTTKTFGEASDPGIVLGDDDIFLIDIGPVLEKWEGDGGDTFVTGTDPDKARCAIDARTLFHTVRRKWRDEGATAARFTTSRSSRRDAWAGSSTWTFRAIASRSFRMRPTTQDRSPTSTSRPRPGRSGCSRSTSGIPASAMAPSTRTCCLATNILRTHR